MTDRSSNPTSSPLGQCSLPLGLPPLPSSLLLSPGRPQAYQSFTQHLSSTGQVPSIVPSSGATVQNRIDPARAFRELTESMQSRSCRTSWATVGTLEDQWEALGGLSWQSWLLHPPRCSHSFCVSGLSPAQCRGEDGCPWGSGRVLGHASSASPC